MVKVLEKEHVAVKTERERGKREGSLRRGKRK